MPPPTVTALADVFCRRSLDEKDLRCRHHKQYLKLLIDLIPLLGLDLCSGFDLLSFYDRAEELH